MKKLNILTANQYFQLAASLSATLSMVSDGMHYSWSSPSLPILRAENTPIKITKTDEIWLEAMFLVAALAGLPITPVLVDKLGRRKSILAASSCSLIAWIIIGLGNDKVYLYIGRFIAGAASDAIFVIVPMYISEIADRKIRGFLTGLVYVMMVVGILIMYAIGPFVPLHVPPIVSGAILIIHLLTFYSMPESPYYLVAKSKVDEALKSLKKFSGEKKCEAKLKEISEAIKEKSNLKGATCKKSTLIALGCVTVTLAAQHFCGFSAILMNLHTILEKTEVTSIDVNMSGIFISLVKLAAVIVSSFTVDKYGRKMLLILSSILTGFSLLGIAIYFHLKDVNFDVEYVNWLPVLFIVIYAAVFNLGLGVVPKVVASELFSNEFKAIGMTFGDAVYVVYAFVTIFLYNYLVNNYQMYLPFYIFGGASFSAALLIFFIVPETKGKSLEEIQAMLEK